jgi:hypothetical protein
VAKATGEYFPLHVSVIYSWYNMASLLRLEFSSSLNRVSRFFDSFWVSILISLIRKSVNKRAFSLQIVSDFLISVNKDSQVEGREKDRSSTLLEIWQMV